MYIVHFQEKMKKKVVVDEMEILMGANKTSNLSFVQLYGNAGTKSEKGFNGKCIKNTRKERVYSQPGNKKVWSV